MAPLRVRDQLVTVYGGSGFIGRHVVRALARRGYRVRVAVRRPELAGYLRPLGSVGQIHAVQANLRHPVSIRHAAEGAAGIVNLVAILFERGRQRFQTVHVEGAAAVAEVARDLGITQLAHVSAIGADPEADSVSARTKADGEAAIREQVPEATIFRPSIVFGPEDHFFNRFAAMARVSPVLPLIGGGHTRFQPVFVGDVAQAIARAIDGEARPGTIYELGGPQVFTFRELMEIMLTEIDRRRLLVTVPWGLARLQAAFLQFMPKPLLTPDQVRQLAHDNVVSQEAVAEGRTLDGLGITAQGMAAILPTYLQRYRRFGQYTKPGIPQDLT